MLDCTFDLVEEDEHVVERILSGIVYEAGE
jgi:hypothetical protein